MSASTVIRLPSASPNSTIRALQEVEDFAWTDMGWGGEDKWTYRLLPDAQIMPEMLRLSQQHGMCGHVDHISFQPCQLHEARSQDRYVVQNWDMPGGQWTFSGVFDGHGSHSTVDFVTEHLPPKVKTSLHAALASRSATPATISRLLSEAIVEIDNAITLNFLRLFPRPEDLAQLRDKDIAAALKKQGVSPNSPAILRCMQGSTALLTLVDPSMTHLWVANLGDCRAVLISKSPAGAFKARRLNDVHNGGNPQELRRVRNEHPGEQECVLNNRVLGFLAPTRALGDTWMKIPSVYSRKALRQTKEFWTANLNDEYLDRIKTPPYVSSTPQVYHEQLRNRRTPSTSGEIDVALVLCSDGLTDLYEDQDFEEEYILKRWAAKVGEALAPTSPTRPSRSRHSSISSIAGTSTIASTPRTNVAAHLLRDAIGGDDLTRASANLTVEMDERWMDDTTIVVHRFI